jgi:acetylornithine deacetylase/succinyl-diaminopimelate desuccinylase-like protein
MAPVGRAVADDKTSIISFLAAFDALKAMGRSPSVNLKVLWEGEEEAGSRRIWRRSSGTTPRD